jgi:Phytanoyl-CoA dioxygenase (PhyH)
MLAAVKKSLSVSDKTELKSAFERDGFFVVRDAVPSDRLDELHKALKMAFEAASASGKLRECGGLTSGHINCYPGAGVRTIYASLQERGIIDLMQELGPQMTRMPNVGCNFNIPGSHAQHYHTDRTFAREFIIANVAVVDTVVENGAIDLVPGTHKRFYRYKDFVIERPHRNNTRVLTKRGDVMVRSSNVWHRGMPNRTSVPRAMLAFTWEDGGSMHDDPFNIDGGKIKFLANWYTPTAMGRLREHVFVKAPIVYSTFRLGRSLVDSTY